MAEEYKISVKDLTNPLRISAKSCEMTRHTTWAILMNGAADTIEQLNADFERAIEYAKMWEGLANGTKELLQKEHDKVPKWISVKERLPEPETEVLAAFDDGYVWAMWQKWSLADEYEEGESPFDYYKDVGAGIHTVTHWMLLPKPPMEVSE